MRRDGHAELGAGRRGKAPRFYSSSSRDVNEVRSGAEGVQCGGRLTPDATSRCDLTPVSVHAAPERASPVPSGVHRTDVRDTRRLARPSGEK